MFFDLNNKATIKGLILIDLHSMQRLFWKNITGAEFYCVFNNAKIILLGYNNKKQK